MFLRILNARLWRSTSSVNGGQAYVAASLKPSFDQEQLEWLCVSNEQVRSGSSISPKVVMTSKQKLNLYIVQDFKRFASQKDLDNDAMENLSSIVLQSIEDLSPPTYAHIVNCCKNGRYVNNVMLLGLVKRVITEPEFLTKFSLVQLSMVIQSLAVLIKEQRLARSKGIPWKWFFVDLINECNRRKMGSWNRQDIANLIHGLGLLKRHGVIERKDALELSDFLLKEATEDVNVLTNLLPQHVAAILQGCANLEMDMDTHPLELARIANYIRSRVRNTYNKRQEYMTQQKKGNLGSHAEMPKLGLVGNYVTNYNLTSFLWGLGKVGCRNDEVIKMLCKEIVVRAPAFSTQHLAITVYSLGLLGYNNSEVLESLGQQICNRENLRSFTTTNLANMIYGFGLLGYGDTDVIDGLSEEIASIDRIGHFQEQELANIVYGMGLMGHSNETVMHALAKEICTMFRLSKFKSQELSNIVYALGLLKHEPSQFHLLAQEVSKAKRLRGFKVQELANIVHGLGRIGYRNEGVLAQLGREIVSRVRLGQFNDQELVNIVYGFGSLGFRDKTIVQQLAQEVGKDERVASYNEQGVSNLIHGFGQMGYRDVKVLDILCARIRDSNLVDGFSSQTLLNVLNAFALLGYRNADILNSITTRFRDTRVLDGLSNNALSVAMYCLGKIGFHNENVLMALASEMEKLTRMGKYQPRELANFMYAFGRTGYFDETALSSLFGRARNIVGTFDHSTLANVLYGVALMRNNMPDDFLLSKVESLLSSFMPSVSECIRSDECTSRELANVVWSLAKLQYYDASVLDEVVDRWLDMIGEPDGHESELRAMFMSCAILGHKHERLCNYVLDNFANSKSSKSIINMMWGLCTFHSLSHEKFTALMQKVMGFGKSLDPNAVQQVLQCWTHVKQTYSSVKPDGTIDDFVRDIKEYMSQPKEGVMDKEVAFILEELGVKFNAKRQVGECGWRFVDFEVVGNVPLVIEVDEVTQFAINEVDRGHRPLGITALRNRLLENAGYKVLIIPHYEWKELDPDEQREWLEAKLKLATQSG